MSTLTDQELLDGYKFDVDADLQARPDIPYSDEELLRVATKRRLDAVNTQQGAPASVRAQVSAAQTPEDKLLTLRNFYPDAAPVEVVDPKNGASKFGAGNFIFTDPETGEEVLFDEDVRILGIPAPTLGDLADAGPEIAEFIGATAGSIYGGLKGAALGAGIGATRGGLPPAIVGGGAGLITGAMAGEGAGGAIGRETYIKLLDYFGETEDNRTGLENTVDFGATAALNAFGGPVANKIFTGVKNTAGRRIRIANDAMTSKSREIYELMVEQGFKPTIGQVSDSKLVKLFEKTLANLPTSTNMMHQAAKDTLEQINKLVQEKIEKYGTGTTAEAMSRSMNTSLENVNKRYVLRSDQLYNRVKDQMPEGLKSEINNTVGFAAKYLEASQTASRGEHYDLAVRKAQQLIEEAQNKGGLTFDELKMFRSQIREIKEAPVFNGGSSNSAKEGLNSLYSALTHDLDNLVKAGGEQIDNPNLYAQYQRASRYVKQELGAGGGTAFARELIDKNKKNITSALKAVETGSRNNVEVLRQLKKSFTEEEWKEVSGYMMGALGTRRGLTAGDEIAGEVGDIIYKGGENFNPSTFLTNINKMSPEAKTLLFGGKKNKQLLKELNDLTDTIARVSQDAKDMANPSGTARIGYMMALFTPGAVVGGAGWDFGLTGLAAPWMSAKLMVNPDFVRWMSTGVADGIYDPQSMAQHVRRLLQIWKANPEIRGEIEALLPQLQTETLEPVDEHAARSQGETEGQAPRQTQEERNFQSRVPASIANELMPDRSRMMAQLEGMSAPDMAPVSVDNFRAEEMPFEMAPEQIDNFSAEDMPDQNMLTSGIQGFDPLPTMGSGSSSIGSMSMSPTVLPDAGDRELAMRQSNEGSGIASLV
tara:strand:- start:2090 stop:4720 length:2631 start_codon:yes stop_codon:yes gene_type:complete